MTSGFPFTIASSERIGMQNQFSEGEIMYIDGGVNQGVAAGDEFFIMHREHPLKHPVSNADMGIVYSQVGRLKVLCAQENTAIAEITYACDPVVFGDVLLPFNPIPVPLVLAARPDRPLRRAERQAHRLHRLQPGRSDRHRHQLAGVHRSGSRRKASIPACSPPSSATTRSPECRGW